MEQVTMDKIVNLCKGRGFIYPGSEIYGGLANTWDYGPLGVLLKNSIKNAWWKKFVQESPYNVGIESSIIMNPGVWKASGHVSGFNDPLMDCKDCKSRYRADKLIEETTMASGAPITVEGWTNAQMKEFISSENLKCPKCGSNDFTDIRKFNLMFKTYQGVTEDAQSVVYLRPETAQGIFVNFANIQRTTRKKMPFGIAQIGKSFRNEITPGNFIFRTREFEMMELEFFCKPGEDPQWFDYWKGFCRDWLVNLGLSQDNIRLRDHKPEELSHYSKATTDIEYKFPFGWGELWGIANRTDYDLKAHIEHSGKDMSYLDPVTNERYIPYCVEPSVSTDRLTLAFLCNAYTEEDLGNGDSRVVLKLHPVLAPVKVAVLPLSKKLSEETIKVYEIIRQKWPADFDDTGSIGKRYRRHDEIGTPFCVTIDFQSLEDHAVTIRMRDSMEQIRLPIPEITDWLEEKLIY